MALIQETQIAFGRVRQSALHTANILANFIRVNKLNAPLMNVQLVTEDDAAWIGKGHEFAEANYASHWDVSGTMEKIASAEFLGWALAFAMGKVETDGEGPTYTHTITPMDPVTDDIALPSFSYIEAVRQGASAVLDRMAVGCCIEEMTLEVASGAGLQNCKVTVQFAGCGMLTEPSAIVIPAATAENLLRSAGLTLSVHESDIVLNGRIISLKLTIKNNIRLDSGFHPGSGFQTALDPESGAIRGRMEHGIRQYSIEYSARFLNGSPEWTALKAQSEGTAVFALAGGSSTSAEITVERTRYKAVELTEAEGIVTANSGLLPMMHSANGLITAEVVNTLATLG